MHYRYCSFQKRMKIMGVPSFLGVPSFPVSVLVLSIKKCFKSVINPVTFLGHT